MGRELRRVPPNWQHPKNEQGHYKPLFGRNYLDSLNEWFEQHNLWEKGAHPDQKDKDYETPRYFAEWDGDPPEIEYYRTYTDEEATWYQLYETVSEGKPVSPAFETKEELVDYLVVHGDFWYQADQERKSLFGSFRTKPTRQQAESLVETGWAMSGIMVKSSEGVKFYDAYEQQDIKTEKVNK